MLAGPHVGHTGGGTNLQCMFPFPKVRAKTEEEEEEEVMMMMMMMMMMKKKKKKVMGQ